MNKIRAFLASVKMWQLIILLLAMLPITAYSLRHNSLRMVELRDEVVRIDSETGDIAKVKPALETLRSYVLTHMNTSLATPLELPGSYNRAVEQARKKAEASGTANGDIYRKAQQVCENPNVLLSVRAQCIQDYVTTHAKPGSDAEGIEFPPKELFSYNFTSPLWSFDLAGFAVLFTVVLGIWIMLIFIHRVIGKKIVSLIEDDPLE